MIDKEFKLFTNCFPVKGVNTGIIVDIQRKSYYILPNQIIDLINEYSGEKIYTLFQDLKKHKNTLKQYMRYFTDNELVIITNDSSQFPPISNDFEMPFAIDTITIGMNGNMINDIKEFLEIQIDLLGISCLKLVYDDFDLKKTTEILHLLETSKIKSIILFVKHQKTIEKQLIKLESKFSRITEIVFYDIKPESIPDKQENKFNYDTRCLNEILSMKVKDQNHFVLNIEAFNEALLYNTAYNRTVYIDNNGKIKRHIEDNDSFGNINQTNLNDVIERNEFKEFWAISKDKIKICKDCEFRYICPDGSIPYKEKKTDILYSIKTKCNYDPYENKWIDTKIN
jgi:SPASM domain peptide maturase of grasp-with-spasm system